MPTYNKNLCCFLLPLLLLFGAFFPASLVSPLTLLTAQDNDANNASDGTAAQAEDQALKEISEKESQDFTNDSENDYIDSLREIIAIGSRLASQVNEAGAGNDHDKYFVEYVASDDPKKFGADIFSLSKIAGVNHIRNLRHIISGYLRSRYNYNKENADIISTSITNYNAIYRQNMDYMQQKYAPAVLQKLNPEHLGLSLHHEGWAGQTQMLIPLKPEASAAGTPQIDLVELKQDQVVEFDAEPVVEVAPVVEPKPEPAPKEVVPPPPPAPRSNAGIIILVILLVLLLLLLLLWLKRRKREPEPAPVVVPPKPVVAKLILSRYFPQIAPEREELQSKTINQRIEVPYDQYQDWQTHIVEQIHQGKISTQNLKAFQDPKDTTKAAASVLSRGNLTYLQAKNISKSGQIKVLRFDEQTAIVHTTSTFGIGCIGQFAIARWNGIAENDALRIAVLQELISGNIPLNNLRKKLPQDISDKDLIQSFELISWSLVDKLYKAADFGKDAVCNAATVLLERDIRGGAAKSYLAKVLRSNSIDSLVKMPIRILPNFAAQKFTEGEDGPEASHSAVALFILRFAQCLDKEHLHNEVCRAIEEALRSLREDYAMTATQYYKEIEPILLTKPSESSYDAWIEELYQHGTVKQDFVYREFEADFAEVLSQKELVDLRDEQIQAEIDSLEQQILQTLK